MTPKRVLVTGGAGFIGSNFIRYLLSNPEFSGVVVNADCLTYAGNPENLADVEQAFGRTRYFFELVDIRDQNAVKSVFERYSIDTVVHFAAESHVDRSIHEPSEFISTNVMGTFNLLETAKTNWAGKSSVRFHHVSTDEVYGSLGEIGRFTETTPYDPRSPYSASKAASDHLVMSYAHTFGLPVTLTNSSNNYGPYQFPEKLIPYMITAMSKGASLPIYGDGRNVRDWLFVEDHNRAVWLVLTRGREGQRYNVGGENEWENIRLVETLCEKVANALGESADRYKKLITFVKDRPGHDRRYATDCTKIKRDLAWERTVTFEAGLENTVGWYLKHETWTERVKTGAYRTWVQKNYTER